MDTDILNYADNRINYRRFSNKVPNKNLIEKIINESFMISPMQNLKPEFNIDIFDSKYEKEKENFVLFTVCESDWGKKVLEAKTDKDLEVIEKYRKKNWNAQIYAGDYGVNHLGFNHQVKAPYLLRFTSKNEKGCINAGIYSFAISLVSCKYKIDASFCKCFKINKNFPNPITTTQDNILFYLGLGIYDETLTDEFFKYKHNRKVNFDFNNFIQWR